jgi:hypothetical protein
VDHPDRRHPRRLAAGLALVVALGSLAGCGDDDTVASDDTTSTTGSPDTTGASVSTISDDATIVYRYGDSSVPPEYHRSYTLEIDRTEVAVEVDSYGEVLHSFSEPLPAEVWEELVAGSPDVLGIEIADDDEGCAGGTSRALRIDDGGETLLDVGFAQCGDSGTVAAATADEWVRPVIAAVPDWSTYLATD